MNKSQFYPIGYFAKTHGINGELLLKLNANFSDTEHIEELIFAEIDGGLVPFFVEDDGIRFRSNESILIRLEDITTKQQAAELINCPAFTEKPPTNTPSNHLPNLNELIGFSIADEKAGPLGTVSEILDYSSNILLKIDNDGHEILLPATEEFILSINTSGNTIYTSIPQELINLNN